MWTIVLNSPLSTTIELRLFIRPSTLILNLSSPTNAAKVSKQNPIQLLYILSYSSPFYFQPFFQFPPYANFSPHLSFFVFPLPFLLQPTSFPPSPPPTLCILLSPAFNVQLFFSITSYSPFFHSTPYFPTPLIHQQSSIYPQISKKNLENLLLFWPYKGSFALLRRKES